MKLFVRLSSLLLLIGVGSYVCYKLIIDKNKKKRKKKYVFGFNNCKASEDNDNNELFGQSFDLSSNVYFLQKHNILTSTPFINLHKSLNYTPSITSSNGSDLLLISNDFLEDSESLLKMPSLQTIGNNTVAKLDQLLDQIQDIKKSVFEIDEQIFDVKESNVNFESKLFRIVPEMSSSLNTESDSNDRINYLNIEPQTPSLEWDLTDLTQNHFNYPGKGLITHSFTSYLNHDIISSENDYPLAEFDSPQDLSSPSTSGEFSIPSPSEPVNCNNNSETIQKMIDEAKRLGILNDLIDILVKNTKFKRDSAYFED